MIFLPHLCGRKITNPSRFTEIKVLFERYILSQHGRKILQNHRKFLKPYAYFQVSLNSHAQFFSLMCKQLEKYEESLSTLRYLKTFGKKSKFHNISSTSRCE